MGRRRWPHICLMFIRLQCGVECLFPPIIDTYFTKIFMVMRPEHVRMVWFIAQVKTLERVAVCNVQRCELIPHALVIRRQGPAAMPGLKTPRMHRRIISEVVALVSEVVPCCQKVSKNSQLRHDSLTNCCSCNQNRRRTEYTQYPKAWTHLVLWHSCA